MPGRRLILGAALLVGPLLGCAPALADPFNEPLRILERWTSVHWGRDCFVWVVHYPGELVEPWVEAEALRSGMSEAERLAYRERFVSDLRLDNSETFLVSVHSFGARPVSLAPASENVALLASSGVRVPPVRYDSGLDSPANGIVQGLVFFPKQGDENFSIVIKGMADEERLFSFEGAGTAAAPIAAPEPEVVVVDLPKRKGTVRPVRPQKPRVVEPAPPTPPAPPVPREVPPLLQEDSRDMAAFVESVKAEKPEKAEKAATPKDEAPARQPQNLENAYVSREHVLRQFLGLWADNRPSEMYDMLADASRRIISRENFAKEVAKASDLRAGLRDNYRIEWIGEERARVVTDRRLLMFRSLLTRTLGVVREGSSWKIVW